MKVFKSTNRFANKGLSSYKFGFTLAEVLITLGIIGVVAAMTIPNLIQNIKDKETYTKLKATQSILTNAIRLAEDEYGDMSGWNVKIDYSEDDAKEIAKVLKQYLKISLDCGTNDVNGYCTPAKRYIKLNGADHGQYHNNKLYYKIALLNGSSVWWSSASQSSYKNYEKVATFFIDVNGPKLPNQMGRDLFIFPYEKGSLRPNGAPGHSEADTCKLNNTGQSCSYFVLQNGHMKYPKN